MTLQTEFEFNLPKGYVDEEGTLHKDGVMRLATAADEILPLKDPRVQTNPAYVSCIVLSRTITKMGSLPTINPKTIEGIFAGDLSYLQSFYKQINGNGNAMVNTVCPKCDHKLSVDIGSSEGG